MKIMIQMLLALTILTIPSWAAAQQWTPLPTLPTFRNTQPAPRAPVRRPRLQGIPAEQQRAWERGNQERSRGILSNCAKYNRGCANELRSLGR